jgi:hypothetical protein
VEIIIGLLIISGLYGLQSYFQYRQNERFFNAFLQKLKEMEDNKVVTVPWENMINNPESTVKDDDLSPMEEVTDEKFQEAIKRMTTSPVYEKDGEAEEAKEEIL